MSDLRRTFKFVQKNGNQTYLPYICVNENRKHTIEDAFFYKIKAIPESEPAIFNAYSQKSIIAEKFHAMVVLSYVNSRMKEFYDIYNLLKNDTVYFSILEKSIEATFTKRETPLYFESVLEDKTFSKDEKFAKMWKIFLQKKQINIRS